MNAFTTTGVSAGLLGKIDELERTVPEARIARSAELSARSSHSESNSGETLQNGNYGRATSGTLSDAPAANPADVSSANGNTSSSAPPAAPVPFSPLSVNTRAAAAAPANSPAMASSHLPKISIPSTPPTPLRAGNPRPSPASPRPAPPLHRPHRTACAHTG